jgi:hypothetical protein
MDELDDTMEKLHAAQDMVAYLEPPARMIIGLRERQVGVVRPGKWSGKWVVRQVARVGRSVG